MDKTYHKYTKKTKHLPDIFIKYLRDSYVLFKFATSKTQLSKSAPIK